MSNIFNIELKRNRFNKTQVAILKALHRAQKPTTMAELEEGLDIKRLTLYYNLKQLQKRGFVRQDRTQKIYTWTLEPLEMSADSVEISVERAYEAIARSPSQKLWGIQGGEAIKKLVEEIKRGTTYRLIHHRQRLRQVIVDAIFTTRGMDLIKQVPREELASHLHRPTILHATADTAELDPLEIITDGKRLFIIDRRREKATVLHDAHAVSAYLALHETIKALSTKMRPQEVYGEL
ncbi:helix-turn-helix domain-containing protein [Candidatus Kaiserbacteria bacterium]|nr:helix-turn-helix domain-containing protein [Candidatus Kaiserbacteria bacterium]